MKNVHIVLASSSPRRKDLLSKLGWYFEVLPSGINEGHPSDEQPDGMVKRLSKLKGDGVARRFPYSLVISSDTAVACDGRILGKPRDPEDAFGMIKSLSGRTHKVFSGLALFWKGRCICDCDCTEVTFRELSDDDIRAYVSTGEGIGCAGSYAIQGKGALLVKSISGDYSNVVGLPMPLLADMMARLGFSLSNVLA